MKRQHKPPVSPVPKTNAPQIATEAVAQKLGVRSGALLQAVVPGGAGAAAGLLPTRRGLGGIVRGWPQVWGGGWGRG